MDTNNVINDYFEWSCDLVCGDLYSNRISYRKLLMHLHGVEFVWYIPMDENRAKDGLDLRYRFSVSQGYEDTYLADYIDGPCSVL